MKLLTIIVGLTLTLAAASASEESSLVSKRAGTAPAGTALLTLDAIFGSGEFDDRGLGQFRWSKRTPSYFTLETPESGGKGRDLMRNDLATGRKEVVVPASAFIPPGQSAPLDVQGFELSVDESKLLIYTNSKRVWRRNTRGDYWVLELAARTLQKLRGNAAKVAAQK